MLDCSSCPHAAERNAVRDYESSPCRNCKGTFGKVRKQIISEPTYDIERNYACGNFPRRLSCVRIDIVIFMVEHPGLSQKEIAHRMKIPRSTIQFQTTRIKRMLPELFH